MQRKVNIKQKRNKDLLFIIDSSKKKLVRPILMGGVVVRDPETYYLLQGKYQMQEHLKLREELEGVVNVYNEGFEVLGERLHNVEKVLEMILKKGMEV